MSLTLPLRRLAEIPGPAGSPGLGMVPALRRDILGTLLDGLHRHGDVVAYRIGPAAGPLRRVVVAAHHPDDVHRVLTGTGQAFGRRTVGFQVLSELFGRGLLTTEGETWLRQRRTLQPLFTPRRVAGYAGLMEAEAARVVDELTYQDDAEGVVDLHALMMRYTLRVVGRALFGEDVDAIVPALQRLVPLVGEFAFARSLQIVRAPLGWPTPRNRRLLRVRAEQYEIVDGILAQRSLDGGAGGPGGQADDMVTRLLAARDPDTGRPLSPQEISDQILVFLLAGHETTAGALTFTLHLLGRHAEAQERVAAEAPAEPSDAAGTPVTRAALQEGMRLFPPAYVLERVARVDTEIGGYAVPAGTAVLVSPWVTHRHPQFWPQPDRFDPDRFLGGSEHPRYAYFPFGGGPRSCIGEHFANLEASILLRTLLARFRVESLDATPALTALITLRPAEAVRAKLVRR